VHAPGLLRAWLLGRLAQASLISALAACTEHTTAALDAGLALNAVELPQLSCRGALTQASECARRADCGEGQQCTLDERVEAVDRVPIALRCGPALGTGKARARCSEASECESGLCALAGVCLEPCASSRDCPDGQTCQPVEARAAEEALAPVIACARVSAFPPDVELNVSAQALRSEVLNRFSVSELGRTSLVFLKADCARALDVRRIVDKASQRTFFDTAAQLDGVVQINPSVNAGALLPLLLPNNPRVMLSSEGYDLGVSVDQDTDVHVIRASRTKRGHILDLNVFYVGGGKLVEEGGLHPGSSELLDVIARLGARYEAIGVELGAVREYDVVGALREELSVLQVATRVAGSGVIEQEVPKLGRLFELSAGVDDGGLNLFIVESMGPLLGISGGTPGAVGLHGSALSGVALALDSTGLMRADKVLFHELGHQLGLFHTSEMDGFEIEPLSDTPACSAEQDSDGDGTLRASECADHGADNVMFWEGSGDTLSPQQIDVLTRALILRER
jgi:hypothetical protein